MIVSALSRITNEPNPGETDGCPGLRKGFDMAYDVHIHLAFSCSRNEGVAELAKRHAAGMNPDAPDGIREAKWFLDDLAERTGRNLGPKGGLCLWGMTGNYTRVGDFCEVLRPFWLELLTTGIDGGPLDFERVIVFEEQEQSEQAIAYEIGLEDDEDGMSRAALFIRRHELPFAWMQF